tara:strand:- start:29658 stop:30044 length:387 start_codon:yes stop_codon:yes gene_type:complete
MWNECKGFVAIWAIFLLAICLIIIGMFAQREASNDELPRLKPKEVSMNFGVASMAHRARPSNYAHAQMANTRRPTNVGFANMAPMTYSYSVAPHAQVKRPTSVGIAPHAKVRVYPNNPFVTKPSEKKK